MDEDAENCVLAKNIAGEAKSSAQLIVEPKNKPENTMELKKPEFLRDITDVEVKEGQSVKFRCKVKGIPQPKVVWYKDGQIIMNQLNYKLERVGNRDYILAIDSATMDEDAEYCVLAKNIAGEAKSSAQLIVEPKNKPESVPITSKSPKHEKPKEKPKSENEFPDLSYLGIGRSKSSSKASNSSTSSVFRTPGQKKESSGTVPKSPQDTTDSPDLHNMSETLEKTKESVSDVAEDMLSSTKEKMASIYEERRVVLVGKTGNGKSSTGNTILGIKRFEVYRSLKAVTSKCSVETSIMRTGRPIYKVCDTPGFNDAGSTKAKRGLEVVRSVTELCKNPHAFLLVFSIDGRITEDECCTIDLLRVIFGEDFFDHCILVFTRGGEVDNDKDFTDLWNESPVIKLVAAKCGNRVVRVENKSQNEESGLDNLLTMIEEVCNNGSKMYDYKEIHKHVEGLTHALEHFDKKAESLVDHVDKEEIMVDHVDKEEIMVDHVDKEEIMVDHVDKEEKLVDRVDKEKTKKINKKTANTLALLRIMDLELIKRIGRRSWTPGLETTEMLLQLGVVRPVAKCMGMVVAGVRFVGGIAGEIIAPKKQDAALEHHEQN